MPATYLIATYGYKSKPLAHLTHVLRYSPCGTTVVDVRRDATGGSPRYTTEAILLHIPPTSYLHLPALGNHPDAPAGQWKLLHRDDASAALDLLVDRYLAGEPPVLLLCAEMHYYHCHRRVVADVLRKRLLLRAPDATVEIKHLL